MMYDEDGLTIDNNNFIRVDDVPVFKYFPKEKRVEFVDKNKSRSRIRGTRYLSIRLDKLVDFLESFENK